MKIRFDRTGIERKALVAALSEITGCEARFLHAPTFSYSVGHHTITRDGSLETEFIESISSLLAALEERGFIPTEKPELPCGSEAVLSSPGGSGVNDMTDVLAIELPAGDFSDLAYDNLVKLVAGKADLIRSAIGEHLAIGAEALPVMRTDERICFPWFRSEMRTEKVTAWSGFACALCELAKKQKRVSISGKPYDGSEKYGMRCFLLKLGFIGEEYREARRLILSGMTGNGSHKNQKEATLAASGQ